MGKHLEQTNQTRQNIIDAFWSMAESDGVRNISVSAVVKRQRSREKSRHQQKHFL